jgi:hypothetical protein
MNETQERLSVRLSFFERGEIHLDGAPHDVSEWMRRLQPYIDRFSGSGGAGGVAAEPVPRGNGADVLKEGDVPEAFGQYFHEFRDSLTDVDRVLIAGHYLQCKTPDRAFDTGAANGLLKDQGIRVGNASECVRRNLTGKRIFALTKGNFRLSTEGLSYLKELRR